VNKLEEYKDFLVEYCVNAIVQQYYAQQWSDRPDFDYKEFQQAVWNNIPLRIKPKEEYRPFKNKEEVISALSKHQPVGYIYKKDSNIYYQISRIDNECIHVCTYTVYPLSKNTVGLLDIKFNSAYKSFIFADGTPFGIINHKEYEYSKSTEDFAYSCSLG
jgi:hypothetical protein